MGNGKNNNFVELWISHNTFFWEQVRAIPFVEAVILAGVYSLFTENYNRLAVTLLAFGTLLLLLIFLLLKRHAQHARAFREAAGKAIPEPEEPLFGWRSDSIAVSLPLFLALFNVVLYAIVNCYGT